MKTFKRVVDVLFLYFILICLLGCASSQVQTVNKKSAKHTNSKVIILPFQNMNDSIVAIDHRMGTVVGTDWKIIIDGPTYTYTFEKDDYANLKKSLVQSLKNSNLYDEVITRDSLSLGCQKDDIILYYRFDNCGMKFTPAISTCILHYQFVIINSEGKPIKKSDIKIEETSMMSVSAAKNKAIRQFVNKTYDALSN
jgi:hypothetical protein